LLDEIYISDILRKRVKKYIRFGYNALRKEKKEKKAKARELGV
jgi:hypothetical protein